MVEIAVQRVKVSLRIPATHTGIRFTPLPMQLPANVLGKGTDEGTSIWVPAAHTGDLNEVPGFGPQPTPALPVHFEGVNQQMEECSLSNVFLTHWTHQFIPECKVDSINIIQP